MEQTIYQNGRFKIVPLIVGYRVVESGGRVIYPHFQPEQIELAVNSVDELAIADGCYRAVA